MQLQFAANNLTPPSPVMATDDVSFLSDEPLSSLLSSHYCVPLLPQKSIE